MAVTVAADSRAPRMARARDVSAAGVTVSPRRLSQASQTANQFAFGFERRKLGRILDRAATADQRQATFCLTRESYDASRCDASRAAGDKQYGIVRERLCPDNLYPPLDITRYLANTSAGQNHFWHIAALAQLAVDRRRHSLRRTGRDAQQPNGRLRPFQGRRARQAGKTSTACWTTINARPSTPPSAKRRAI